MENRIILHEISANLKSLRKELEEKERGLIERRPEDRKEIEEAIDRNSHDHSPSSLPSYSYSPYFLHSLFSKQTEFGKPVKPGKRYPNVFFSDLATIQYHLYFSGVLSLGLVHGIGRELTTAEKKRFKVYSGERGLYQRHNGDMDYLHDGDYKYIVSPKGGLYLLTKKYENAYHNCIRASQPVQCAGHVGIRNKQIVRINNASGHYCPTYEQLFRTLGGLYAAGFIGLDVRVEAMTEDDNLKTLGTLKDLIKQDEINIPKPWVATTEFSNRMKRRI